MKIVWHGKGKRRAYGSEEPQDIPQEPERPRAPNQRTTWMEDLISSHEKKGAFQNLPGKGKPLKFQDDGSFDSVFGRILKDADAVPEWVSLHKEIRRELEAIVHGARTEDQVTREVERLNQKIRVYNTKCPSPLLQRPTVRVENLEECLKRWQD